MPHSDQKSFAVNKLSPRPNPFDFLNNGTAQALLGNASAATPGRAFLSTALGLDPNSLRSVGGALWKMSIGNTLTDAINGGQQELSADDRAMVDRINSLTTGQISAGALESVESSAMELSQLSPAVQDALEGRREEVRSEQRTQQGRSEQSGPTSVEQGLIDLINRQTDPNALNKLTSQLHRDGKMTPAVDAANSKRLQTLQTGN